MKKILLPIAFVLLFSSCAKKQAYFCKFGPGSQGFVPGASSGSAIISMTNREMKKFVEKQNTSTQSVDCKLK
jgi:hypothetical protein